jgi:hypothetical protein
LGRAAPGSGRNIAVKPHLSIFLLSIGYQTRSKIGITTFGKEFLR